MDRSKKIIILSLSLLLPVVVFIFLKSFGKNEFEVKPLFQDSVSAPNDCPVRLSAPYSIPDSVLSKIGLNQDDSLSLVVLKINKETMIQIDRILKETSIKKIKRLVVLSNDQVLDASGDVVLVSPEQFSFFHDCILLLKGSNHAVVVDSKGRIAGQYNLEDLDDADRLIMETKIILKEY